LAVKAGADFGGPKLAVRVRVRFRVRATVGSQAFGE